MATLQDYLQQPTWRAIYALGQKDDGGKNFGNWSYGDGFYTPLFTDANSVYAVRFNRHDSRSPYDSGIPIRGDGDHFRRPELERCYDTTDNPHACARRILSNRMFPKNPFYETQGSQ
jgi:hypothetical protein